MVVSGDGGVYRRIGLDWIGRGAVGGMRYVWYDGGGEDDEACG